MNSIGIYCGSSFGFNPVYREKAEELGHLIGQRKMTLVYIMSPETWSRKIRGLECDLPIKEEGATDEKEV